MQLNLEIDVRKSAFNGVTNLNKVIVFNKYPTLNATRNLNPTVASS